MLTNQLKTAVGFIILFVGLEVHSGPHLAHAAVSQASLRASGCPSSKPMTDEQYENWAENLNANDRPPWLEVGPLRFENEDPNLAFAIMKMASKTDDDYLDYLSSSTREVLLTWALDKARDCKKAICVAKKVFGERIGPRMLYLFHNYRFNASNIRYRNVSLMTVDEMEDVITALRDIPAFMLPTHFNRQLIRFKRGYTLQSYNSRSDTVVLADSSIKLFDYWGAQSSFDRKFTVVHEAAHLLAIALSPKDRLDTSKEWLSLGGWFEKKSEFTTLHPVSSFISEYASSSPYEDFAESFAAYRYSPQSLLAKSPGRYQFMKDRVFRGMEYLKSCPSGTR